MKFSIKFLLPLAFSAILLAGMVSSCKQNPVAVKQDTTAKKDSTKDTTHVPCDTCDTTHKPRPNPNDTTSHNFAWQSYSIPNETSLTACWVFAPNDIYVLGNSLYKLVGGVWKNVTPNDSRGFSLGGNLGGFTMFAFRENDYWLIGDNVMLHYDGTEGWDMRVDSLSGNNSLHSAWGVSSTDMYAAGDGGTILHFDGSVWTMMQSGTKKQLRSIWGVDDNNIWASGTNPNNGESVLLHYDGSAWSEDPLSVSQASNGAGPFNNVWAVDSSGQQFEFTMGRFMHRKTLAQNWVTDSAGIPNDLRSRYGPLSITGSFVHDLMIYGDWGYLSHWNGSTWYQYPFFYEANTESTVIESCSILGNTVCAVGTRRGGSWILIGQR